MINRHAYGGGEQGRLKTGRKKLLLHLSPALTAPARRDGADADQPGPEAAPLTDAVETPAGGAVAQRMERLEKASGGRECMGVEG